MDFKKIKEELKTILYGFDKVEETPAEQPTKKVYTESELNISEKQVGGKVELVKEDGSLEVAPDGDYETESGDKFTVKDGFISEWNGETEAPVKDEEVAPEQELATEEAPAQEADWKAEVDALKAETESLKAAMGEKASQEQAMSEQFNSKLDELNTTLKTLATIPAEFSKTNTSHRVQINNTDKTKDLKAIFGIK